MTGLNDAAYKRTAPVPTDAVPQTPETAKHRWDGGNERSVIPVPGACAILHVPLWGGGSRTRAASWNLVVTLQRTVPPGRPAPYRFSIGGLTVVSPTAS